jgi:hypothetical protein
MSPAAPGADVLTVQPLPAVSAELRKRMALPGAPIAPPVEFRAKEA